MWKYLLFLATASLLAVQVRAQDKSADLAVIVAKGSSLENLSSDELRRVFLEEKATDPDGHKYVVMMREPGSPEQKAALSVIYKFDQGQGQFDTYFLRAVYSGHAQGKPQQVNGGATVRQYVAATPGGIGYLRASEVDDSVKVIKVDGKSPGDADYPLKIK